MVKRKSSLKVRCRLSTLLGNKKMSMAKLSRLSGVNKNTLLGLYHERLKMISFDNIAAICEALGCQIGDLFELVAAGEEDKVEESNEI